MGTVGTVRWVPWARYGRYSRYPPYRTTAKRPYQRTKTPYPPCRTHKNCNPYLPVLDLQKTGFSLLLKLDNLCACLETIFKTNHFNAEFAMYISSWIRRWYLFRFYRVSHGSKYQKNENSYHFMSIITAVLVRLSCRKQASVITGHGLLYRRKAHSFVTKYVRYHWCFSSIKIYNQKLRRLGQPSRIQLWKHQDWNVGNSISSGSPT